MRNMALFIPHKLKKQIPLIALCLGFFMVIIDVTIVNIALPSIAKSLSGGMAWLQWIVDGYTLTFACLLLSAGYLGDRFGSKNAFLGGLTLFVCTSIGCGLVSSFWQLIFFRLLQGVAAALLVPTSLALINGAYQHEQDRAKAIGIWASMGGIAAVLGPLLGAILTSWFGWRAIFFVNFPVGMTAFFLTWKYIPRQQGSDRKGNFDIFGQLTGIMSIASLAFSLIEAGRVGWTSGSVIAGGGIFLITFFIFLVIEHRSQTPMLPLEFFHSTTFSTAITVGMILNIGVYGELFVLSLYFQQIRDYSLMMTGLAFMPLLGVVAVTSYLGGKITSRRGPRLPMVIGLLVGALGFWSMLIAGKHTPAYLVLILPLVAIGFGIAFAMPATTAAIICSAPEGRVGVASGALNASRQTGSLIGVAIFGTILSTASNFITGLHITLLIAGLVYLSGGIATLFYIK